ncbi:MAG TPA: hypothetical protein VEH30_13295 [Terriglobales bacterium]|nr:hypothetical protein [Terriglobales bacterium]
MRKWLTVVCTFAVLLPAAAQTRGGIGFGGFRTGGGFSGYAGRGFVNRNLVWFGAPFSYSDYPPASVYQPPASPVVIIQPTSAPAPAEAKPEPLMIEWQGDKYVRFVGQRESSRASSLDYSEAPSGSSTPNLQHYSGRGTSHSELAPAILIFRDGHHENVSDYVIANGNLYARGDYWRDGFWTKTVQLSALDIPATLRANSESGVNFVLPSSPNEVVTRP